MGTVQLEISNTLWTAVNKEGKVRDYVYLGYYTRYRDKIYRVVPQGRTRLLFLNSFAKVIVDKRFLYIKNNVMYITYYTQVYPTVQTSGPDLMVVMKDMDELKGSTRPEKEGLYMEE